MEAAAKLEQNDETFSTLLKGNPIDIAQAMAYILSLSEETKRNEKTVKLLQALADLPDFEGLYQTLKDRKKYMPVTFSNRQVKDLLNRACKNRMDKAFLAAADFGGSNVTFEESVRRFELLRVLKPGVQVIDKAWGFGVVKRIDDFYGRVTLDFYHSFSLEGGNVASNPNHALSFATACTTIQIAPEEHLFARCYNAPAEMADILKNEKGEFVKMVLKSLGDMPVTRLEVTLSDLGLVPSTEWKSFWSSARQALKGDKLLDIPTRRADNIKLRKSEETYDDTWFATLKANKDPQKILSLINNFESAAEGKTIDETQRAIIADRMAFAIKGAYNYNPTLYAQLAIVANRWGFNENPPLEDMRNHLWDNKRYLQAAANLPVKDVKGMTEFLLAGAAPVIKSKRPSATASGDAGITFVPGMAESDTDKPEQKDAPAPSAAETMIADLAEMPYSLLNDTLLALKRDPKTTIAALKTDKDASGPTELPLAEKACIDLLTQPKAPPTLVAWVFRYRKTFAEWGWKVLPERINLLSLLNHAIAIVENTFSGEDLRMRNYLKTLFEQSKDKSTRSKASDALEDDSAQEASKASRSQTWLEEIFTELEPFTRQLFFERIQASPAWDPSTHRSLISRMMKIDPSLKELKRSTAPKSQSAQRITSRRSYKAYQNDYRNLVEVEIPKNTQDISTARDFGDLSENAEYQYAKDKQRELITRQTTMDENLKAVKSTDFTDVATDKVNPGTQVSLRKDDGTTLQYTILGEWDSDLSLKIISNQTELAKALLSKTVGDKATIPSPDGEKINVVIDKIEPLSEAVRAWIAEDPQQTA
ncbi:MAG: GreA/GreB family elongation factor [Kiritimatiellae bacterium]|nr:GreA/GreB family elongation factor [Kiritimatiellia bacterium]